MEALIFNIVIGVCPRCFPKRTEFLFMALGQRDLEQTLTLCLCNTCTVYWEDKLLYDMSRIRY